MKTYQSILAQIVKWHADDRRSCLKRAFELGDMLNLGILHTRITEYELIRRLREDLGDMAYGVTTYNRACRISRVFTKNQREVLISKCISLEKAESLAGERYAGRKRVQMIANIKSGKTKSKDIHAPHRASITADADLLYLRKEGGLGDGCLCQITLRGDEGEEVCENAVTSLFSALKAMHKPVKRMAEAALERVEKVG